MSRPDDFKDYEWRQVNINTDSPNNIHVRDFFFFLFRHNVIFVKDHVVLIHFKQHSLFPVQRLIFLLIALDNGRGSWVYLISIARPRYLMINDEHSPRISNKRPWNIFFRELFDRWLFKGKIFDSRGLVKYWGFRILKGWRLLKNKEVNEKKWL